MHSLKKKQPKNRVINRPYPLPFQTNNLLFVEIKLIERKLIISRAY